jgi:hypothetical protein
VKIRGWASLVGLALLLDALPAAAFPHVVRAGETLAQIAERVYGRVEMEQVLVAANALDVGAGVPVVPGMRLEVPAVGHHRITAGETWDGLAEAYLGDATRSDLLATANDTMPWLPPDDGREIMIPFNLRYVVREGDSTMTLAYRFLGERDLAWKIDRYNHLGGDPVNRGDVLLIPLVDLALTDAGKDEAASAGAIVRSEGASFHHDAQRRAALELPALAKDNRSGRWVEAVARGNRLLGSGELSQEQRATIQRHLVEAYVALETAGLAEDACIAWRDADPGFTLDPVELSPKIIDACTRAAASRPAPPPAPTSVPASSASAP